MGNAKVQIKDITNFKGAAQAYEGQKVAVICARYNYRGIISKALDDCLILSNACAIQTMGAPQNDAPENEDATGCDVVIKYDAVEILFQPNFCLAPLPSEDDS